MSLVIKKLFLLLFVPINAYSITFEADYDGDGVRDQIIEENYLDKLKLTMFLSPDNNSKHEYMIERDDDEIEPKSHLSFSAGEIEIDSSYSSQGGNIFSQVYKWDTYTKKWFLTKIIEGEKSNILDNQFTPNLSIKRIQCCYYLGDNSANYFEKTPDEEKSEIEQELDSLKLLVNSDKNDQIIKRINIYLATEYINFLNNDNVDLLNIIARLINESDWQASAIILEKIVETYPNRVISVLDLANAYWNSEIPDLRKKAISQYKFYQQIYIDDIPDYVIERIKSE